MRDLERKVAIVTGTSGIARSVALRLWEGGASVAALGVDAAVNAALAAEGITVHDADVADATAVAAAVASTVSAFGGLDIVVNAAAIHPYGTAEETDFATVARCLAVNVGSVFNTARAAIPHLRARGGGGGAIVNIASVQGHACQPGVAAYVATKEALHALTRAMALDHAAD